MCKDDGWFIRHVEPPNACRPSDNPTDSSLSACAPASTSGSILSENALHCRPGASKSPSCPQVLAGQASTMKSPPTSLPSSRPAACPGYRPGAQRQRRRRSPCQRTPPSIVLTEMIVSASKKGRHTRGLHLTVFSQTRQEPLEKTVRNTASRDRLDHLRESNRPPINNLRKSQLLLNNALRIIN